MLLFLAGSLSIVAICNGCPRDKVSWPLFLYTHFCLELLIYSIFTTIKKKNSSFCMLAQTDSSAIEEKFQHAGKLLTYNKVRTFEGHGHYYLRVIYIILANNIRIILLWSVGYKTFVISLAKPEYTGLMFSSPGEIVQLSTVENWISLGKEKTLESWACLLLGTIRVGRDLGLVVKWTKCRGWEK